jgi:murein DD-endopeptidase MepM/ murein hydrolase activator NlpD
MSSSAGSIAYFMLLLAGCAAVAAEPQPGDQAPPQLAAASFSFEGRPEQGGLLFGTAPAGATSLTLDGKPIPIGPGGRFLLGLDRDQAAVATVAAQMADGRTISERLQVAPRAWAIQYVDVAQRPPGSTADYLRIRQAEQARIKAARQIAVSSDGWRQRFIWPVKGRISGVFGSQRVYRGEPGSYHSGVDVAPGAGTPVVAPADGVVVLAGPPMFSLEGNLVIIAHGMGLDSAFLHLATTNVRVGQKVKQGQLIGTVGATGRATGPHLHWSMKWLDSRIDPQAIAGPMGSD